MEPINHSFKAPVDDIRIIKLYRIIEDYFRICQGYKPLWNEKVNSLTAHKIKKSALQQNKLLNTLEMISEYQIYNPRVIEKLIKNSILIDEQPLNETRIRLLKKIIANPDARASALLNDRLSKSTSFKAISRLKKTFLINHKGVIDLTRLKLNHFFISSTFSHAQIDIIRSILKSNPTWRSFSIANLKKKIKKFGWLMFNIPQESETENAFIDWIGELKRYGFISSSEFFFFAKIIGIEYAVNIDHFNGIQWKYESIDQLRDFLFLEDEELEYKPMLDLRYSYSPIKFDQQDIILAYALNRKYFLSVAEGAEILRMFGFISKKSETHGRIKNLKYCCVFPIVTILLNLPITIYATIQRIKDISIFNKFLALLPRYRLYKFEDGEQSLFIHVSASYEKMFYSLLRDLHKNNVIEIKHKLLLQQEETIRCAFPESIFLYWDEKIQEWSSFEDLFNKSSFS